jgi:alkanesulfonate monooxygenase SsuD/methylene tetrahydromethanopterin reductase-like flavin-dependent oxidoreductase (luciferase family)
MKIIEMKGEKLKFAIYMPNFGYSYNPLDFAELAKEAESAGWDGFFLWDHLVFMEGLEAPVLDPWITLSAIAMNTKKIKIGPLITPISRRRPWKLAREIISLDHLSNGRLIFGVGLGAPEYDFTTFGESFDNHIRAKKLDEGLEVLLGFLSGNDFSYEGDYYKIRNVKFKPAPLDGKIPIWVAGMWPNKKPFLRASKFDGVFPIHADWPQNLTIEDVRKIKNLVFKNRPNSDRYDIIIAGETPSNTAEGITIVEPYKKVGVTWWCEHINLFRFKNSKEKMLKRVRWGPPR